MMLSLVRHTETVVDPNRNPAHWPLSERGLAAARKLALQPRRKTLSRLVSSGEQKAISTAECLSAATGLSIEISPGINEVERPSFQQDYEAWAARFFDCPNSSGDDWETAAHALARSRTFINSLGQAPVEQHIALVGHGMLWALARSWLLGNQAVDPSEWKAILMPDVSTWSLTPSGVALISDFLGIIRIN